MNFRLKTIRMWFCDFAIYGHGWPAGRLLNPHCTRKRSLKNIGCICYTIIASTLAFLWFSDFWWVYVKELHSANYLVVISDAPKTNCLKVSDQQFSLLLITHRSAWLLPFRINGNNSRETLCNSGQYFFVERSLLLVYNSMYIFLL
jgi:hypothetical protein